MCLNQTVSLYNYYKMKFKIAANVYMASKLFGHRYTIIVCLYTRDTYMTDLLMSDDQMNKRNSAVEF